MKITLKLASAIFAAALLAPATASAQKVTLTLNWVVGGDHAP